jgi:DNA-binding transcriptional MerR regulator
MLAITGLAERRLQSWIQRGFFSRAARPGRGVAREYSLADILYLKYLRVLTDARVLLQDAASSADYLFPASHAGLPQEIRDVPRSRYPREDLATQIFCIFHDGLQPLIVTKAQLHDGEDWGIIVNVTGLLLATIDEVNVVLNGRTQQQWETWFSKMTTSEADAIRNSCGSADSLNT